MNVAEKPKIVLLGLMSKMPVAGVVWQTLHYLVGFQRLGYDVYYVEAHGTTPRTFFDDEQDDGWARAASFIDSVMKRFDLGDRWAYYALHGSGQYYGLSKSQVKALYDSAALIINLHGGTIPLPEHSKTGRLIYLETDPVEIQIQLHSHVTEAIDYLSPHSAFFTFAENYGHADCKLPVSERFDFKPTRQPVVLDFWPNGSNGCGASFTTIGNWQQPHRQVNFNGEVYHWSKHYEFLKFLDLPARTNQPFELALSSCDETDKRMLEGKGWQVRHALDISEDADDYRKYIAHSRGEFTVAKDQNVRLRTGWFSDRSATYLAAGKPVITQETGFSNILPTGEGLFAFSTVEEVAQATEKINSDYDRHSRRAREIGREYFSHQIVLEKLLADLSVGVPSKRSRLPKLHRGTSLASPAIQSKRSARSLDAAREMKTKKRKSRATAAKATDQVRELRKLLRSAASERKGLRSLVLELTREREDFQRLAFNLIEQLVAGGDARQNGTISFAADRLIYARMLTRIRSAAADVIPAQAAVAVASKGDDDLLKLRSGEGWHFPQSDDGSYAGYYPACSGAAIAHLEVLRAKGAEFLVLPRTAFWWFDKYSAFRQHVERFYELKFEDEEACLIYDLREARRCERGQELVAEWQARLNHFPVILDWSTGTDLHQLFPDCTVFSPVLSNGFLPYVDGSINVVAVSDSFEGLAEARRVASEAVVRIATVAEAEYRTPEISVERLSHDELAAASGVSIVVTGQGSLIGLPNLFATLPGGFTGEITILNSDYKGQQPAHDSGCKISFLMQSEDSNAAEVLNRAVRNSRSEIIIFVDCESVLLHGWMPSLLQVLRGYAKAGAVGGKILNLDGSIYEAGGIVLSAARLSRFGCGDQKTDDPRYNYVREADFCSVGVFATRRSLFEMVGCFDTSFSSIEFALADYCLRLQERGSDVFYQPEAVAVRVRSQGEGKNARAEADLFARRWQDYVLKKELTAATRHAMAAGNEAN